MKKPASDQQWHERRHQERKREKAARKPIKKIAPPAQTTAPSQDSEPSTRS